MNLSNTTSNQQKLKNIIFDLVVGLISVIILLVVYHGGDWEPDRKKYFFESEKSYRNEKVLNIATEFFREYSKPTRDNLNKWGMKDFRVVGYHSLIKKSIAGKILVTVNDSSLENYTVKIPFSFKGIDLSGKKVVNIRTLELEVSFSNFSVVQYSVKDEREIRITDRIIFWLKTTFIFPLIIFAILAWFCIIHQLELLLAWRGTRFIGTLNSVYTSYISWDSIVVAIVGTIIYFCIYLLLIISLKYFIEKLNIHMGDNVV